MTAKSLLLTVIAAFAVSARAAGESYMSLAGQLYGIVELPRMVKAHCAIEQPSLREHISNDYDLWEKRNKSFLAKAREQFAHAEVRVNKEGASLSLYEDMVLKELRNLDSKELCRTYGTLLSSTDRHFTTDAKQLLEAVAYGDAELTKRGE